MKSASPDNSQAIIESLQSKARVSKSTHLYTVTEEDNKQCSLQSKPIPALEIMARPSNDVEGKSKKNKK